MAKNNVIYSIINSHKKVNSLLLKLIIKLEMKNVIYSIINFHKKDLNLLLKLIIKLEMKNVIYSIINSHKKDLNLPLELLKCQEVIHMFDLQLNNKNYHYFYYINWKSFR